MALITDQALQEITGLDCNETCPITACNCSNGGLQSLQIDPVITGNREPVIAPLDMGPLADPVCENVLRVPNGTPVLLSPSMLVDEQRSFDDTGTIEDRPPTMREVIDAGIARQPQACPRCGSKNIGPTWLAENEWDCAELDCLAVWTVES